MKTNFEELLNNTNLSIIDILLYYQEEILNELAIYKKYFNDYCYSKDEYDKYLSKIKLKDCKNRFINLIKEFAKLTDYIIDKYYLGYYLHYKIYRRKKSIETEIDNKFDDIVWLDIYLPKYTNFTILSIKKCILKLCEDLENENIAEPYIAELNRLLDEKESKIYELEDKNRKLKLAKVLGD